MRPNWRLIALLQGVILLVIVAFVGGMVLPGVLRSATGPASVVSSESPPFVPAQLPSPSPTPEAPSPRPPPAPAKFVVISLDWRGCYHPERPQVPPICLGHGVFQNIGGTAASVAVVFSVPNQHDISCVGTTQVTPPNSASEASCDLGLTAENYYNVHDGQPAATIRNP